MPNEMHVDPCDEAPVERERIVVQSSPSRRLTVTAVLLALIFVVLVIHVIRHWR